MKAHSKFLGTGLVVLTLMGLAQPTNAQSKTRFVCGTDQGAPATMAVLPDGTQAPIIRFTTGAFAGSGFSNEKRCEEISERFQYFNDLREIDFMTIGKINGQNVICVTRQEGGDCSRDLKSEGLLITVRPGVDPRTTLNQLIDVRTQAGAALNESAARPYVNTQCLINAGKDQSAFDSCSKNAPRLSDPSSATSVKVAPMAPAPSNTNNNKRPLW
jgi:hypothetical protein